MDEKKRTLAAISVVVGFFFVIALIVGVLLSGKKILSPVPEDEAIKIIFVSPTTVASPTLTGTPTPSSKSTTGKTLTPTKKPTATATPEMSVTPTLTKTTTPTPTP